MERHLIQLQSKKEYPEQRKEFNCELERRALQWSLDLLGKNEKHRAIRESVKQGQE